LREPHVDHAFAHLRLADHCVQSTTRRQRENPPIAQGPGVPEPIAAGVLPGLMRVAASPGARL